MDGVVIKDQYVRHNAWYNLLRCDIQNSIVCDGAQLGEGCKVVNCQVGVSFTLEAKSAHKNEALIVDDLTGESSEDQHD